MQSSRYYRKFKRKPAIVLRSLQEPSGRHDSSHLAPALLEQRQLSEIEMCVISLDVSRALNYLHQKNIVHRDVSSANVLLWRQGDRWRGKVSDYGTAKFMQQTMTVAPGALIYSAPEALTSNQTDKVS